MFKKTPVSASEQTNTRMRPSRWGRFIHNLKVRAMKKLDASAAKVSDFAASHGSNEEIIAYKRDARYADLEPVKGCNLNIASGAAASNESEFRQELRYLYQLRHIRMLMNTINPYEMQSLGGILRTRTKLKIMEWASPVFKRYSKQMMLGTILEPVQNLINKGKQIPQKAKDRLNEKVHKLRMETQSSLKNASPEAFAESMISLALQAQQELNSNELKTYKKNSGFNCEAENEAVLLKYANAQKYLYEVAESNGVSSEILNQALIDKIQEKSNENPWVKFLFEETANNEIRRTPDGTYYRSGNDHALDKLNLRIPVPFDDIKQTAVLYADYLTSTKKKDPEEAIKIIKDLMDHGPEIKPDDPVMMTQLEQLSHTEDQRAKNTYRTVKQNTQRNIALYDLYMAGRDKNNFAEITKLYRDRIRSGQKISNPDFNPSNDNTPSSGGSENTNGHDPKKITPPPIGPEMFNSDPDYSSMKSNAKPGAKTETELYADETENSLQNTAIKNETSSIKDEHSDLQKQSAEEMAAAYIQEANGYKDSAKNKSSSAAHESQKQNSGSNEDRLTDKQQPSSPVKNQKDYKSENSFTEVSNRSVKTHDVESSKEQIHKNEQKIFPEFDLQTNQPQNTNRLNNGNLKYKRPMFSEEEMEANKGKYINFEIAD